MKNKLFLLAFFFVIASFSVFAQNNLSTEPAKIIFMRSTGLYAVATPINTYVDEAFVCGLKNKHYIVHEVSPGIHTVAVQMMSKKFNPKTTQIEIPTEPGKTYYIQTVVQMGALAAKVSCQEVTENSANALMPELQEELDCK